MSTQQNGVAQATNSDPAGRETPVHCWSFAWGAVSNCEVRSSAVAVERLKPDLGGLAIALTALGLVFTLVAILVSVVAIFATVRWTSYIQRQAKEAVGRAVQALSVGAINTSRPIETVTPGAVMTKDESDGG